MKSIREKMVALSIVIFVLLNITPSWAQTPFHLMDGTNDYGHLLIPANIRIEPETLNLNSKGVLTAFVQLPEPYAVETINVSTAQCQGATAISSIIIGNTLILKFNQQELLKVVPGEKVEFILKGELIDGSIIHGRDLIRIIN